MDKERISKEQELIIKEEDGTLVLEIKMPEKLREEMQDLAEYTSGAIVLK